METTWRLWALALAATASATAVSESDADLCPHTTHPGLIPHPLDYPIEQENIIKAYNSSSTTAKTPGFDVSPTGCARACCATAGCSLWTYQPHNDVGFRYLDTCLHGDACCILERPGSPGAGWPASPTKARNTSTVSGSADAWASPGFAATFSSHVVLQRAPQKAALYGNGDPGSKIAVTLTPSTTSNASPIVVTASVGPSAEWKAFLPPQPAGGSFTASFSCTSGCASHPHLEPHTELEDVTFGDVFVCSGQSNMWLPLAHTTARNRSFASIRAGRYANIRTMMMWDVLGNHNPNDDHCGGCTTNLGNLSAPAFVLPGQPEDANAWMLADGDAVSTPLLDFSAVCWYFAEARTNLSIAAALADGATVAEAAAAAVPIGLIQAAVGGTRVGQWSDPPGLLAACADVHNKNFTGGESYGFLGMHYRGMIQPLLNTSVGGWLWYQGENDIGLPTIPSGNSLNHSGYACAMQNLVTSWRASWASSGPGATDPKAPFGIVTLAAGTSEGHPAFLTDFRIAQTGSYGYAPNPVMPNVYVAQAYDLGDPWQSSCNVTVCGQPDSPWSTSGSQWYMGPIHPRVKHQLGHRLAYALEALEADNAVAAAAAAAGGGAAAAAATTHAHSSSGPVFSGCRLTSSGLSLMFSKTLMVGADGLEVRSYGLGRNWSALDVATTPRGGGNTSWETVDFLPATATLSSVGVDLSRVAAGATIVGVRYAYGGGELAGRAALGEGQVIGDDGLPGRFGRGRVNGMGRACCGGVDGVNTPCPPESCPLFGSESRLPAVPFVATVSAGKCACQLPFDCSA